MGSQGGAGAAWSAARGLSWRVATTPQGARAVLFGALDRQADLHDLAEALPEGVVELHLGGISRVDPHGLRAWLAFRAQLGARPLVLTHLSPPVVDAVNQVTGFAPRGAVRSLYAVWACDRCRRADERLVELEAGAAVAPRPLCERCAVPLTLADLPERVWHFLA